MLTYKYTAKETATGKKVTSEVQADNEQTAARLIKEQGLLPLNIEVVDAKTTGLHSLRHKVKTKDRVLFSRQLATLINAGLPLVQSLRSVSNQTTSKPLESILNKIISDVEGGATLSSSMAKYPAVFNRVYISLIAAGEMSGTLDQALDRLAIQQEKDAEIVRKVRGAMIYPIIVLLVMGAVVSFMIVKVLPQVEGLYKDLPGARLPLITRILLVFSSFITHFWWIAIVLAVGAGFLGMRYAKTPSGRRLVDRLKMHMWPTGPLFMKLYMARFARTGSTLFSTGVPLIQTLEITGEAINNVHIEESLKKATEKVRGGKALSDTLKNDPNFLELVPNMLRIGEQSGAIEKMLAKTADYFEKEVEDQIKSISTLVEPLLMVILGIVAFIIVAAVLLPIYGLAGQTIIK